MDEILISPFLATFAIAVGVPILLFYVYGIVPVSLCRAGCRSSSNDDYKFDVNINDENRTHNNSDGASIDAISRIGETSIGDVSLSATSESIASRTITQRYCRESTVALAGSVANQKVECPDDLSIGSTSAVTFNSDKSSNVNDINSGIVLAGSLSSYK